ncbi:MAG: hypothetical protein CMJ64_00475 [Planctomycetaceae bacterium]|nr:hypothetical protein [Planctomycetaceae bacterium]
MYTSLRRCQHPGSFNLLRRQAALPPIYAKVLEVNLKVHLDHADRFVVGLAELLALMILRLVLLMLDRAAALSNP